METISIQLKPETVEKVDQIAQRDGRPRSQYIRRILEREVAGASRLTEPEAFADAAPGAAAPRGMKRA